MPSFTTSEPKQSGQSVLLDPGEYSFEVLDAVEKRSKNGNDMIELKIKVNDTTTVVYDNLVFTERAGWKIDQFLKSVGAHPGEGRVLEVEADNCLGQKGTCTVATEEYDGQNGKVKRNIVTGYTWEEF